MTGATRKNHRQPPWEGPDAEGISFGTWLRQQREVRQIGLREVAESSKISLRYLQAFEQDQFDLLPATVFAKGFLRQYSAYVGLNPDEVINYYLWARRDLEPDTEDEPETPVRRRGQEAKRGGLTHLWPLLVVAPVLLLVVAGALWYSAGQEDGQEPAPPVAYVPPPPVVRTPPPPEPPPLEPAEPVAPLMVSVEFTRDCWVDAVVDGGIQRITKTFLPGEPLQIAAQERVVFRQLGNSGGVRIEVNGRPFPIQGREGKVLNNLVIDLTSVEGQPAEAT